MKYLIVALSLFSASAFASDSLYGSDYLSNDDVMTGGMGLEPYEAYDGVRRTQRNVFGGEDYYGTRGYMGRSIPNAHGGRDFYPSQRVGW